MLFIFFFSLLVMEAREPPKLPTAFVHNQLIIQNQIIIQLVIQVIMVFKLKTSTTFVMEATEPLFFLARSAVELPTVVLAFTVNPNFTWWLSWSWESIFNLTKRRIYITCNQNLGWLSWRLLPLALPCIQSCSFPAYISTGAIWE